MANVVGTADIMANPANILARGRCEADKSSAEADRNSAAANRENTETGVAVIGAAIGGIIDSPVTDSSSSVDLVIRTPGLGTPAGAGAFLTRLTTAIILTGIILRMGTIMVIRTPGIGTHFGSGGAFLTRLTTAIILMGLILRLGTIMIIMAIPLTVTATAIDLRLRSCSADWLKRVTTMAPLMESWGRKLVVRFARMNGRTGHWVCANCAIHAGIPCSRRTSDPIELWPHSWHLELRGERELEKREQ